MCLNTIEQGTCNVFWKIYIQSGHKQIHGHYEQLVKIEYDMFVTFAEFLEKSHIGLCLVNN